MKSEKYICPVCGYDGLKRAPYIGNVPFESEIMDGIAYGLEYGSFDICSCCGFEYGYDDIGKINEYRNNWIKNGAKWFCEDKKPINWDLKEQLKNLENS